MTDDATNAEEKTADEKEADENEGDEKQERRKRAGEDRSRPVTEPGPDARTDERTHADAGLTGGERTAPHAEDPDGASGEGTEDESREKQGAEKKGEAEGSGG